LKAVLQFAKMTLAGSILLLALIVVVPAVLGKALTIGVMVWFCFLAWLFALDGERDGVRRRRTFQAAVVSGKAVQ
jgi:uncharacterized protein involved in cysteine biosynthesis